MQAATHVEPIGVRGIVIGQRLRPLSDEAVNALMKSMADIGLRTPITVRLVGDDEPVLVAGAHRLEAAKRLGWGFIDAYLFEGDERSARMWEIAENLHRADLTALERSDQIAEWMRLAAEKLAQLAPVSRGGRGKEGGTRAAARDIGVDRDAARRAEKVAALSPEAKQVARDAGLDDNQSALLAAASRETPDAQVAELHRKANDRAARKAREHSEVRDAKGDAREVLAQAIADFVPEAKLSDIGAALALLGLKEVASRVQALTGSVFDKGEFGKAA